MVLIFVLEVTLDSSTHVIAQQTVIPNYIRNNTLEWGQGNTTDYPFILTVTWLVHNKMIIIPNSTNYNTFHFDALIGLSDLEKSLQNETLSYDGQLSLYEHGNLTQQEILDISDRHLSNMANFLGECQHLELPNAFQPSLPLFCLSIQSQMDSDKMLHDWIDTGNETLREKSDTMLNDSFNYETKGLHILLNESSSYQMSPVWVKNIASWWGNGQISDSEFIQTLQYLFDNNIIQITEVNSTETISNKS